MFYDFGKSFYIDVDKAKTPSKYVFKGNKYRISIISNILIRFEYSENGTFSDYPTFFARNRSYGKPNIKVKEDKNVLTIENDTFIIEYNKEKPFVGTKLVPNMNLKVGIKGKEIEWYFNNPEVKNMKSNSYDLDSTLDNGLYSLDGYASFDDSRTPILTKYGNIISPNYKNIDTYLFVYDNDYASALKEYFQLTSLPPLIPKYALGLWWFKNETYSQNDLKKLVSDFKYYNIPLSVLLLGDKTKKESGSFTMNSELFPNVNEFINDMHSSNIKLGFNIKNNGMIKNTEENYQSFIKMYGKNQENIQFNVFDYKMLDSLLKTIINPILDSGIDFLWVDDNNKDSKIMNYTMNYYLFNNFNRYKDKRNFILGRNNGISSHMIGALYSGETKVSYKTLKKIPEFNSGSSNIGVSYWAHNTGGYKGGIEDPELFLRHVELSTFSPIFMLSSEKGKYYKREPWKWDIKTNEIVSNYIRLRYKLIPYIYSECRKYSLIGAPLVQPLYYKYPDMIDELDYRNQYYFGSELLVSPITASKDNVMNRAVHKVFLPNGIWYDFKSGKKFIGGKRYTTFYRDEDYPVFARGGAIIPMSTTSSNDLRNSSLMEIQIFPGRSNVFKLYEDDGYTNLYKIGNSFTTQIQYFYKENDFSVEISPLEGKKGIIPESRNYKIVFRNTKQAEDVQVFENEKNVRFNSYTEGPNFIVETDKVKVSSKVLIYCKGKDIEINAVRLINEEVEGIIHDIKTDTSLKEEIDSIMFSDLDIKKKKIQIRKLRRKGLDTIFIKMLIKLLDHLGEV